MLLACTKSWRHVVPLSVVSHVLGGHSKSLRATDVLVYSMIRKCSVLQIHGDPDSLTSYGNAAHAEQKNLAKPEPDVDGVETSLLSVAFSHALVHEVALERYGIANEASLVPLDTGLCKLLENTVCGTITALTDNYLDALQMESIAALEKRRQLLPLTGKFLKVYMLFSGLTVRVSCNLQTNKRI